MKNLGLGIQELSEFKKRNLIYVDKTKIIDNLISSGKYYFLSRPRRFGKSLLVNTIKEMFKGNKDLFVDTWIYDKWNWEEKNPIIKISFSSLAYKNLGLESALEQYFDEKAFEYNYKYRFATDYSSKFIEIIKFLGEKNSVVILIDEYDKPIIDFLDKELAEIAQKNKEILKNLYSGIKDCDKYIKLLFITGVSKFSRVSIFSELNNLRDITISEQYSQIVGYTEEEIIKNYSIFLKRIEKKFKISSEKLLKTMKLWYNGYSWDGENFVYNPFSILNLFADESFSNYWFKSGTPTFLTKMIKEQNIDIEKYDADLTVYDYAFDSYEIENIDLNILLFQTGYLTIKEKIINPEDFSISYNISYPNKEVRDSFYNFLISEFTEIDKTQFSEIIKDLKESLEKNNIEQFIIILKSLYANIPFEIFMKNAESYYHTIIYLILKLLGVKIFVEKHTNKGRIDAIIETKKYIFIIEFKMGSINNALKQLKEKKYYEQYLKDERTIYNVGIAFDEKERNIKEYQIRTVEEL